MDPEQFKQRLEKIAGIANTPVPEGEKEIFKHKYKARADLIALQSELLLLQKTGVSDAAQLAQVYLAIGNSYVETEEMGDGQEYLKVAQKHLHNLRGYAPIDADGMPRDAEEVQINRQCDHFLVDAYNQMGVIWSSRGEQAKAEKFLLAAEKLYHLNKDDEERGTLFEERYLQTAFFLAQVYANLGDKPNSSRYCLTTMQKQLLLKREFDKVEWTTNCLHLSGFFLEREDFSLADYCMRAAAHVISMEEGGKDERIEANLNVAYGKYYSHMLEISYTLVEGGKDIDLVSGPSEGLFALPIDPPISHLPLVRTFDQARDIFKKALPRFEKALQYYNFDGECTTHVELQSDISVLWRNLIRYETDLERRVSMHKRRIALYDKLVGNMQVQCYMSYVRKMTYELGEIWNEIGDIRQQQLKSGVKVGPKKINEACNACIRYYEMFLATFMPDQQTNQSCEIPECDTSKQPAPKTVEEDYQRVYIMANMHIARQYTRLQCEDFKEAAQRLMAARDRYLYALDCAKKYEMQNRPDLKEELQSCEEMAALLPTRLKELRKQYPE